MKSLKKRIYKHWFKYWFINMKKPTLTLLFCSILLSGCMITWPIVDDLDHYKEWDTYESIRNEEWIINDTETDVNIEWTTENNTDAKAIEKCVISRDNDPMMYEDESNIDRHNQFETTEDFCAEFIKVNPMFYNDAVWITETWEPIWRDWEILENY